MKIFRQTLRHATATVAALGLAALVSAQTTTPEIPDTPAPIVDLVSVQTFELERPDKHRWRAERPTVKTGYLLVLKVDPALVYPRQVAEPVLYVGRQTAERINVGYRSGHVVAIVPAVTEPGRPGYLDLAKEPIWFGSPELPERVDARRIAAEREEAVRAGIRPFSAEKLAEAREVGGALNRKADKRALLHDAMRRLVLTYSPQERELVDSVLRPAADRPK